MPITKHEVKFRGQTYALTADLAEAGGSVRINGQDVGTLRSLIANSGKRSDDLTRHLLREHLLQEADRIVTDDPTESLVILAEEINLAVRHEAVTTLPETGKGLFVLQKGGFSLAGWDKALNAILFAEQEPTLRREDRHGQTSIAFFDRKTDKEVFVLSRSLDNGETARLSDLGTLSAEQKQYFYDLVNHLKQNAGVDMSTSVSCPSVNLRVANHPNPTPGERMAPEQVSVLRPVTTGISRY